MAIPGGFQFHSVLPNNSNFDEVFAQSCHMVRNQLGWDAIDQIKIYNFSPCHKLNYNPLKL